MDKTRPDLLALQVRNEIVGLLRSITDTGSSIDTGGGLGAEDIHFTVGGNTFHMQISHNVTIGKNTLRI